MKKTLLISLLLTFTAINHLFGQRYDDEITTKRITVTTENNGSTYKKNAFGLDFGFGKITDDDGLDETAFDFGLRYMYYFNPYIGADFFKYQMNIGSGETDGVNHYIVNPQFMIGIRGSSPQFANNRMHAYAAFRFGFGATVFGIDSPQYSDTFIGAGSCYEFEIGIHLTRTFFIAYAYNYQGGNVTGSDSEMELNVRNSYSALRIGFNFGKNTPY